MILRIKNLKRNEYSEKVDMIKKKLSTYSDSSFFNNMFIHFQTIRNPEVGVAHNFPWCCFLAMKWKYTTTCKLHPKEMSYDDFVKIINRIYDLQNEAANLPQDDYVLLSLRRMMINQLLYQSNDRFNLNSLIRQYIWYCQSEDDWYSKAFLKITDLSLESYYKMALYFTTISCVNSSLESEEYPVSKFAIHLVPLFGVKNVKSFLNLTCLKMNEIRPYLAGFKNDRNITMEYYEDTPMLSKPLVFKGDSVTVLCKMIMKSGFVNLVPELLKLNYREEYKSHFGRTLETYVSYFLKKHNYSFLTEAEIKRTYNFNKVKGKAVDFIIKQEDGDVYIDCKAIEPGNYIKTSNDQEKLKQRLTSSFIKGIFQGEECASILNKINQKKPSKNDSLIIIVHRDHFISNAKVVEELIYPELFAEVKVKCNGININPERIYYITIDEFEYLVTLCKEKNISINSVISHCCKSDSELQNKKFNIMMHVAELAPEGIKDDELIANARGELMDEIIETIKKGNSIWSGKVGAYIKIRDYLLQ